MKAEMIDLKCIEDIETLMTWRVEVIEHVFGCVADYATLGFQDMPDMMKYYDTENKY